MTTKKFPRKTNKQTNKQTEESKRNKDKTDLLGCSNCRRRIIFVRFPINPYSLHVLFSQCRSWTFTELIPIVIDCCWCRWESWNTQKSVNHYLLATLFPTYIHLCKYLIQCVQRKIEDWKLKTLFISLAFCSNKRRRFTETTTRLIWTLSMDPLESVLTGFDCICQKKSIEKS